MDRDQAGAPRPALTEAGYRTWAARTMQSYADELNERLADLLPDGVRFTFEQAGTRP